LFQNKFKAIDLANSVFQTQVGHRKRKLHIGLSGSDNHVFAITIESETSSIAFLCHITVFAISSGNVLNFHISFH